MAWYPDLDCCDYFSLEDTSRLRAVGWLERGHEFEQGDVDDTTLSILVSMAENPWAPVVCLGSHDCTLCDELNGPGNFLLGGKVVWIGAANLFVPHVDVVFAAPSMILHYITAHRYRPPEEFIRAIKDCPPMGSREYLDAVVRAGGRGVFHMRRRAP